MSHLLQTIYPNESKGNRSLSLHWSLQRSCTLIMQFEVQNSILHPSRVSQFIWVRRSFIRELGAHTSEMGMIVKNKENYISFSIKVPVDSYIDKNEEEKDKLIELRFIDSIKFMSSSLNSLTKNLVSGGKKLFGFEDYSELQYDLLTRKGVYPYEYINSWDQFNETQLPPIDVFYSNLNMSSISKEDYQHAQKVWEEFGIHDLGDYHNLYLRTDVALLANVYEAFRDT